MSFPTRTASTNADAFSCLRATSSAVGLSLGTLSDAAAIALTVSNLTEGSPAYWPRRVTVASLGTTQNSTPTAAQIIDGIVTQTGQTGAGTVTLPLGADVSAALPDVAVGDSFDCLFANLGGGQTLTLTGATGSTIKGTAAVATGKNALMRWENTGTGTWNVYTIVSA